jgi:formate C-acetyltransferase
MDDFMTRPGDRFQITEEQKRIVYKCLDYWRGKSLRDRVMAEIPRHIKDALDTGVISNVNYTMSAPGHVVPDYAYLLKTGFSDIIVQCEEHLALPETKPEQHEFYNACIVSCKAIIAFARRYSALAYEFADREKNPERRLELLTIAENCANIPQNPASSYWEALQFIYFVQIAMQLEGNGLVISIGRLDKNIGR